MKNKPIQKKTKDKAENARTASAGHPSAGSLEDNRLSSVTQRKLADAITEKQAGAPVQTKSNATSLPDQLKSGIENLSGHSMDDVKVHYNSSQPAQLNAHAYAQGTNIHVAPGQEKHLAHEAWHVVQQKQGRVQPTAQLKQNVNINDNPSLEKEADVMGAKAVSASAAPTLSLKQHSPYGNVAQGYFIMRNVKGVFMIAQEKRKTPTGSSFLNESGQPNISVSLKGSMRVSDDGQMAIENGGGTRQAKSFYASASVIQSANTKLKSIGSPIRLAPHPGILIKTKIGGHTSTLALVYPIDLEAKKVGNEVTVPQRCNEAAPYIGHSCSSNFLKPTYKGGHPHTLPSGTLSMLTDSRLAAMLPLLLKKPGEQGKGIIRLFFESMAPWWENVMGQLHVLEKGTYQDYQKYLHQLGGGGPGDPEDEYMKIGLDRVGERYIKEFIQKAGSKKILEEIGINEFIDPKVGDILSIRSIASEKHNQDGSWHVKDHETGRTLKNPFQYHFATVIAKSGKDYITMENYARQEEEGHSNSGSGMHDPRFYFQMFGPLEQSFHSENKPDYANALTLAFSPDRHEQDFGHDIGSEPVKKVIGEHNEQLSRVLNH